PEEDARPGCVHHRAGRGDVRRLWHAGSGGRARRGGPAASPVRRRCCSSPARDRPARGVADMKRVPLTDEEFAAVARLLHESAGLAFDESRRESLAYCVNERMRACGCADVASYLALVAASDGAVERQQLLDVVTIPETHFFRNPPQIRALRTHV